MARVCVGPELCVDGQGMLRSPQSISTGWQDAGWWTYAPGWGPSNLTTQVIRVGQMVSMRLVARRTGAPITPPTSQNIPDMQVATITDSRFRPQMTWFFAAGSNSHIGGASLSDAGVLNLLTLSTTVNTGNDLVFCATFAGSDSGLPSPCA